MACCDFQISENHQCGSYAFNLWREGIEQKYCDRHHWQSEADRLREALAQISLCSQNSMSSKEECGRIARRALEGGE